MVQTTCSQMNTRCCVNSLGWWSVYQCAVEAAATKGRWQVAERMYRCQHRRFKYALLLVMCCAVRIAACNFVVLIESRLSGTSKERG